MVLTCCIKNCTEQQKQGTNLSFHRFPKNTDLKEKWIKAIKYDNFEPLPNSRICSKHFANDCFVQTSWSSKRVLNANAVPNVLDIPEREYMQETDVLNIPCIKTENEATSSKNDCEDDNLIHAISIDEENVSHEMSVKKKRKVYIGDFKECDMTSEKENYIEVVNKVVAKKNKQIKILQQKKKRLLNKIQNLHSLVDELRNINMINEETSITLSVEENYSEESSPPQPILHVDPLANSPNIMESNSSSNQSTTSPVPPKRRRRASERKDDARLEKAFQILKTASLSWEHHDECNTYGKHVANKLRNYSNRTRAQVEHAINNILFEADMGNYEAAA